MLVPRTAPAQGIIGALGDGCCRDSLARRDVEASRPALIERLRTVQEAAQRQVLACEAIDAFPSARMCGRGEG